VLTHASPASALEVGGALVIGLARFSLDFSAVAEGGVVVHDLETASSEILSLDGLRDCESVMRVPGEPTQVAVHCLGYWGSVEPDKGLVVLELDAEGGATEVASFREADYLDDERPLDAVIVLDADHFFGVRYGAWGDASDPDVGFLVSLVDGTATEVVRGSVGGATLGRMAFDPDTGVLLVPDENDGVIQLSYESGVLEHVRTFAFGLPGMRVRGFVRL
jgi:hypothetical protein